jgi:hypothetical protein
MQRPLFRQEKDAQTAILTTVQDGLEMLILRVRTQFIASTQTPTSLSNF